MPVSANGLHHEWFGDAGLPPVVLCAGWEGTAAAWEPVIGALSDEYRVLVYDQRGTGRSDLAAGAVSVDAMARDLADLLGELAPDEPPAFVGHGLGGAIGLQLAIGYPGLFQRMLVANAWATLDPLTARWFEVAESLLRVSPQAYLRARPLFLYPPAWASEHDAELLGEEADALDGFPGAEAMAARLHAARTWDPGAYRLGTIACPVMVLAAEDDALVPAHAGGALAKAVPGATFASMAHGGHALPRTRPSEFVSRVVDWVR
jgi:aminoacrylate hydrolase